MASNDTTFNQQASNIGGGIGNFLGGVVNPVLGTTQTTTTTTKPKDNTMLIVVVVIVVIVGAYFLLRKSKAE